MMEERPLGTAQVDVDELWVYYESIGRQTPPNTLALAYEQGIPRLLGLFDRFGIRATFFICGRDLQDRAGFLPTQVTWVTEIARRGHEIANHSNLHRNGFARLTRAEKRADIAAAGELIAEIAGEYPVGFKSPGFSFSPDLLPVLGEMGYLYDSSLLPTPYAPLLRAFQRLMSGGHVDPTHYGRVAHGLAPLHPYRPHSQNPQQGVIWEVPVTTMPIVRLPMHSTFVLSAGRAMFDLGLALVRTRRVPINYLMHAADLVDPVADPALASYRFLTRPLATRLALYEHMLDRLSTTYRLIPTKELLSRNEG